MGKGGAFIVILILIVIGVLFFLYENKYYLYRVISYLPYPLSKYILPVAAKNTTFFSYSGLPSATYCYWNISVISSTNISISSLSISVINSLTPLKPLFLTSEGIPCYENAVFNTTHIKEVTAIPYSSLFITSYPIQINGSYNNETSFKYLIPLFPYLPLYSQLKFLNLPNGYTSPDFSLSNAEISKIYGNQSCRVNASIYIPNESTYTFSTGNAYSINFIKSFSIKTIVSNCTNLINKIKQNVSV